MELPIFGSPRQALAYLYAHHRGPTLARPKYHDAPGETGRSHWDASTVGALLYGPREGGGCGVVPGGELDMLLRRWATSEYREPEGPIPAIERRLRAAMRAAGMVRARVTVPRTRRHVEADGTVSVRSYDPSEKSRCASSGNLPMVP